MSLILFNGPLTNAFQPTQAFVISAQTPVLDFQLVVASPGPGTVDWYLEFGEDPDPAGDWYREVIQEDAGNGVLNMTAVIRTFKENGGASLVAGTHRFDTDFVIRQRFIRVQIRASAGTVQAVVKAPFGQGVQTP